MTFLKRPDFSSTLGPAWLILGALALVACAGVSGCTGGGFFRGLRSLSTDEFVNEERNLEDVRDRLQVEGDKQEREAQLIRNEQRRLAELIDERRRELRQLRNRLGSVAARSPARANEAVRMQQVADAKLSGPPVYDQAELDDLIKTIDSMNKLVGEITQERPDG